MDLFIDHPLAFLAVVLAVIYIYLLGTHHGHALSYWWFKKTLTFPFFGSVARMAQMLSAATIVNKGSAPPAIVSCEQQLGQVYVPWVTSVIDDWTNVCKFINRAGDSGYAAHLKSPPWLTMAKFTLLFIEAYATGLIAAPRMTKLATPEMIPLLANGLGFMVAIGLYAIVSEAARQWVPFRAYRQAYQAYAADPLAGNLQITKIWRGDDQSIDDGRPAFEQQLARQQSHGSKVWMYVAAVAVVMTVGSATAVRYSSLDAARATEAAHIEERQAVTGEAATSGLSVLARAAIHAEQLADEWALLLFLGSFGLATVVTYIDTKRSTPLGSGTADLLKVTHRCSSREEEQARIQQREADFAKVLALLQRRMPPARRDSWPTAHDVLAFVRSNRIHNNGRPAGGDVPPPHASPPAPVSSSLAGNVFEISPRNDGTA